MSASETPTCRPFGRPKKQSPSWRLAACVGNVRSFIQLVASERPGFPWNTRRELQWWLCSKTPSFGDVMWFVFAISCDFPGFPKHSPKPWAQVTSTCPESSENHRFCSAAWWAKDFSSLPIADDFPWIRGQRPLVRWSAGNFSCVQSCEHRIPMRSDTKHLRC